MSDNYMKNLLLFDVIVSDVNVLKKEEEENRQKTLKLD